ASTIIAARLLGLPVLTILNLYRVKIPREKRFLSLAKLADGGILTVVGRLWSMSDEILIPDFPEPYTLSVGNLGIPPWRRYKVRLVGPVLRLKASELPCKEELREKLGLQDGPVIFVPISGPQQEKEYFARKIQEILLKMPAEYRIVISLANPERDGVQVKVGNVTIHSWLHNWCEYLKACDMLICRSGLGTISQAICFGKPLLTVPTPSHTEQQNNAFRAEELGVAKVLDQRKLTFESVLSGIREVLYSGYIERAEKLRREVERYDGEQAILDAIIRRAE
ncbi:MAG: glycosyltransferase, partial [Candidatus Bathyarchaeia archaeon]